MFKDIEYGMMVNIIPATSLLPKLDNVKVLGKCGYTLAESISDIAAKHNNIFSTIDKQIDKDFRNYEYLIYEDAQGEKHAIADAWIDTVAVVENLKYRFDVTLEDRDTFDKIVKFFESRAIEYTVTGL